MPNEFEVLNILMIVKFLLSIVTIDVLDTKIRCRCTKCRKRQMQKHILKTKLGHCDKIFSYSMLIGNKKVKNVMHIQDEFLFNIYIRVISDSCRGNSAMVENCNRIS